MKTLNIEIPSGYEVDLEQSILKENDVKIVIKEIKKQLPKTWEEIRPVVPVEGYLTEDFLKAETAMRKLFVLREVYRQGWEPNWDDDENKYIIYFVNNRIDKTCFRGISHFLSFQSPEIRDEFLKNFLDLIETAKPLIS